MVLHQILPASMAYCKALCDGALVKSKLGISAKAENGLINQLSETADALYEKCMQLQDHLKEIPADLNAALNYYHEVIVADMQVLRTHADLLEQITDKKYWPYPTYSDLLFY